MQEGSYMTLGHAFGLDPSLCLALSLLRRGREIGIGIPVLLLWQLNEMRTLKKSNRRAASSIVPNGLTDSAEG